MMIFLYILGYLLIGAIVSKLTEFLHRRDEVYFDYLMGIAIWPMTVVILMIGAVLFPRVVIRDIKDYYSPPTEMKEKITEEEICDIIKNRWEILDFNNGKT